MAIGWIKVDVPTPRKPEIFQLAKLLKVTPDDAFGKVVRFWTWLDGVTVDGRVDGMAPHDVDAAVDIAGFASSLASVGWLVFDPSDGESFIVPNFDRHNGETAKARGLKNARQAKWRSKKVDARPSTKTSTREEKRREEKSNTPLPPFPDNLKSAAFEQSWNRWTLHRVEIRKPLTPTQASTLLGKLSSWGPDRAMAAINHTIAMGWQGIREPEPNGKLNREAEQQRRLDEYREIEKRVRATWENDDDNR